MKKGFLRIGTAMLAAVFLVGCADKGVSRYRYSFIDTFDTMVEVVGYAEKDKDFDKYADIMYEKFVHYHQLFDKYNDYDGINNIKTINDNAGISPIKVDKSIIDMLKLCKEWEQRTSGAVNVAMGPVLEIWHDYRERYGMGEEGELPPMEILEEANKHTDINKLIIDAEAGTVFLSEKGMSLDVGAVAKGYATELICNEMYELGFKSFSVSSGGNIRIMDPPMDPSKTAWVIGLQNPNGEGFVDSVVANNMAVVTSGDYQRYYMHLGQRIHHIIDPKTLMPAKGYDSISIIVPTSTMGDLLSTALYIMPLDEGKKLLADCGANALWVDTDNNVTYTEGLKPMLKQAGHATSVAKEK